MEELRKHIRELRIIDGRWLRVSVNRRGSFTSTMIVDINEIYNLAIEEHHDGSGLCKLAIYFGKRAINIVYNTPRADDMDDDDSEDASDWWGDEAQLEAEKDMQKIFGAMRNLSE
ncbi:hypothetical protein BKI52_21850 [marine bacterium AO1-C]|nr:hypothetical protein BKI52_21850 [marine bacterium AO1-C]